MRKEIVTRAAVTALQATNRGGWFFDGLDPRIKVCLVTRWQATASKTGTGVRIWPAVSSRTELESANDGNAIHLGEKEIAELTDHWVIPWFASADDPGLFERLRTFPRLGAGDSWITGIADSSRWDFSGSGPHKGFAKPKGSAGAWRVLMTRHVRAYGIADDLEFQRNIPSPKKLAALGLGVIVQRDGAVVSPAHPAIVYRYPSTSDNTRTMIATVLPEEGYLYSKGYVHGLRTGDASPSAVLALLGYLNSLVCDWWVRRFADRHVTLPVLSNTPVPKWDDGAQREVARLVSCLLLRGGTSRIPGGHGLKADKSLEKCSEVDLLARIERQVFDGFGLAPAALGTVLEDFSDNAVTDEHRMALERELAKGSQ